MAAKFGTVWAIDIGNNALKALRLGITENGGVEVIGFDNVAHGKILSGPGVKESERDELIAISLRRFVEQNELGKDDIIISVPSQNSFARFVNLPPVEQKRIPEIVKFEASQQIPFDISEVQWDWQLMSEAGGSETKVGIFAIKNEVVDSLLAYFKAEGIAVTSVQMAPMALYNYVLYDRSELEKSDNQAIIILDIGAENTDLVVCTKSTVWQRCIAMGGNAFTKAIANAFKLNFHKAEKLKRTAPMSKYARQIFHAMRPVYSDLASEIQRSLNFYSSSNANTKLTKVVALGGGTRMRGLLKYLRQTLQIPVEKPDAFKKLPVAPGVSAARFHESVSDFGVVYGLGLQALGLANIESNLLPRNVARSVAWAGKAKYFTAAACLLLLVSIMSFAKASFDKISYNRSDSVRSDVDGIISDTKEAENQLRKLQNDGKGYDEAIKKEFEPFSYRSVAPLLYQTIIAQLPNGKNTPEQLGLYSAFASGDVENIKEIPRKQRKQLFVTNVSVFFANDVASVELPQTGFVKTGARRKQVEEKDEDFDAERRRMEYEALGMKMPEYMPGTWGIQGQTAAGEQAEAGFVVTIAGYSPYERIDELLDPREVGDDPNKWGFVTRLLRLDEIVDGNCPFKVYATTPEHFKLPTGEVDLDDTEMPGGIGVVDFRSAEQSGNASFVAADDQVLRDPMTEEVISKVVVLDDEGNAVYDTLGNKVYEVNDHWFALKLKFVWKDAPRTAAPAAAAAGAGRPGVGKPR